MNPFEGSSTVLVQRIGLGLLDTQTKGVFNSKLSPVCKLRSYHDVVEELRKQSGYLTSPEVIIKIVHVDTDHMFISDRKKGHKDFLSRWSNMVLVEDGQSSVFKA